ncbi:MAG: DUF1566 domain-containing protein [Polyangiaceae bacterium]|nr:DUF1566 domain-containing protein [Polyangiaceae bacterium]
MRLRLATVLPLLSLAACDADPATSIVLSVRSEARMPADLDGLSIQASREGVAFAHAWALPGELRLPGTLTFDAKEPEGAPLLLTIEGQQGGKARIQRRARLPFTKGKSKVLRVSLEVACLDVSCTAETTCRQGTCVGIDVDPASLPEFGGNDRELPPANQPDRACYDEAACLASAARVTPVACSFGAPAGDFNVAVEWASAPGLRVTLPRGADGYQLKNAKVVLSDSVCAALDAGRVLALYVATGCAPLASGGLYCVPPAQPGTGGAAGQGGAGGGGQAGASGASGAGQSGAGQGGAGQGGAGQGGAGQGGAGQAGAGQSGGGQAGAGQGGAGQAGAGQGGAGQSGGGQAGAGQAGAGQGGAGQAGGGQGGAGQGGAGQGGSSGSAGKSGSAGAPAAPPLAAPGSIPDSVTPACIEAFFGTKVACDSAEVQDGNERRNVSTPVPVGPYFQDPVTGLSWQAQPGKMQFGLATTVCQAAGGRLPTISELSGVFDYGAAPTAYNGGFLSAVPRWASHPLVSPPLALVMAADGSVGLQDPSLNEEAVCVFGPNLGDPIVDATDDPSVAYAPGPRLLWQTTAVPVTSWSDALSQCMNATDGGYEDWRLPTVKELLSLYRPGVAGVPPALSGPAVTYFSSTALPAGTKVWAVDFATGQATIVRSLTTGASAQVRCVRGGAFVGGVPDTTQRVCLDATGDGIGNCEGPAIFTWDLGQEGQLQVNSPSYVLKGSVLFDSVTGLEWERAPASATYDWLGAVSHCQALGGGFRLPTARELIEVNEQSARHPAFSNLQPFLWAAEASTAVPTDAWLIASGGSPLSRTVDKSLLHGASCVRGPSAPKASLSPLLGGVYVDTSTGLAWSTAKAPANEWNLVIGHCESSTIGGFVDWRLATVKDLASLLDLTRTGSPTPPELAVAAVWTSTVSNTKSQALALDLSTGASAVDHVSVFHPGLCVRGPYQP